MTEHQICITLQDSVYTRLRLLEGCRCSEHIRSWSGLTKPKEHKKYGIFMRCNTCNKFLGSCFIYDGKDFIAYCEEHQMPELVKKRKWKFNTRTGNP